MKMKLLAVVAAFTALTVGQVAHAASLNLITNGNFDSTSYANNSQFGTGYGGQGVTGWTGGSGYQIYFYSGTASTNSADSQYDNGYNTGLEKFYSMPASTTGGSGNFVALDGDSSVAGSISQTLTGLTIGTNYLVSFSWATGQLQSRSGATTENLLVSFGSQSYTTPTVSNASQGSTPWLAQSFLFKATATTQTLTFLSQGTPAGLPPMAALDGVSLVAAPEPASIAMMGSGLVLLAFFHRRRSRRTNAQASAA